MMKEIPSKISAEHRSRKAIVYLRQSSAKQVERNLESQRLQYAMAERAGELGFLQVETIDCDLGCSAGLGAARRTGFDSLIAAVARGEVGIVLSREVSRLSRTDKDWCRLLEVCQIFGTLIGDESQVYDLSSLDDQLVLGIKGTMSVVELKVLKMRMLQGQEAKARRGELTKRLPSGYVKDSAGHIVKTPDQRVREAIGLVFSKFRELWSVRQTFKWFSEQEIELPVNSARGGKGLTWRRPTLSFIQQVLTNPYYAGAYIYGRRTTQTKLVEGRLVKLVGRLNRAQECRVFIPGHHEGYIDWATFEEHQRIIHGNYTKMGGDPTVSVVRDGQGLLGGLLRCGRCGRKLSVRYWGKSGTSARYLCGGDFAAGGEYCLGFGGRLVDQRIGEEILKAVSPLGVEASLQAITELEAGTDGRRGIVRRQLEQLEYEAQRAFEQYNEVDPRNRLVANELERRWNGKLEEVAQLKVKLGELEKAVPQLTTAERNRIFAMGQEFADVWNSPRCPGKLKKKIAHTIIEEIIATDMGAQMLQFIIHWKGGVHTEITMPRPLGPAAQKTTLESLEIIRKMAVRYGDDQIAAVLNKHGHKTGKGKRWNKTNVETARRTYSITGQRAVIVDPDVLTLSGAARYCHVSPKSIEKLAAHGLLKMHQVVPYAPWEIRRCDLDAVPVRGILEHLCRTGELVLQGDSPTKQMSLPIENKGDDNARHYE
jgi:DNA invertase Pin-like site-specific DNA recombinase